MKKALKFSKNLIPLIEDGTKTATWRLWDDKDLKVGDKIDFLESGSLRYVVTCKVIKVLEKSLGSLTNEDKKGHEPFTSDEEMYQTFANYYSKDVNPSTIVKIVWFEKVI
jgi:hypothetical protein